MREGDQVRLMRQSGMETARITNIDPWTGMTRLDRPLAGKTEWSIDDALAPTDMPATVTELVRASVGEYLDHEDQVRLVDRLRQIETSAETQSIGGLLDEIDKIIDGHGVERWEPTDGVLVPEGAVATGNEERIYPDDAGFSYVNVGDLDTATVCLTDRGHLYLTDIESMARHQEHRALMAYAEEQNLSDLEGLPAPTNLTNLMPVLAEHAKRSHLYLMQATPLTTGGGSESSNALPELHEMVLSGDHIHDAYIAAIDEIENEFGGQFNLPVKFSVTMAEIDHPDMEMSDATGQKIGFTTDVTPAPGHTMQGSGLGDLGDMNSKTASSSTGPAM